MDLPQRLFSLMRLAALMLLTVSVLAPGFSARMSGGCCALDDDCETASSASSDDGGATGAEDGETDCPCDSDCPDDCPSCSCCARLLAVSPAPLIFGFDGGPFERSPAIENPVESPPEGTTTNVFRPPRSPA